MTTNNKKLWKIIFKKRALKALQKMNPQTRNRITAYMREHVECSVNPKGCGKALSASLSGLWRYRVGDYRVVCHIQNEKVTVLVLAVGHRAIVYNDIHL